MDSPFFVILEKRDLKKCMMCAIITSLFDVYGKLQGAACLFGVDKRTPLQQPAQPQSVHIAHFFAFQPKITLALHLFQLLVQRGAAHMQQVGKDRL